MKTSTPFSTNQISAELKELVHDVTALFGGVIRNELGDKAFDVIESIRSSMANLRGKSQDDSYSELEKLLKSFDNLKKQELHDVATSFTLMLELMNVCENAYRSHRLSKKPFADLSGKEMPESIVYVLTAHPTEARSPHNIAVFHDIQNILTELFNRGNSRINSNDRITLNHLLHVAWRTPIVRNRSPKVKDEAEHIYSTLFRDEILFSLLDMSAERVPVFLRSWVGGDKDGHPGVNEKVMMESLTISRNEIIQLTVRLCHEIQNTLDLFPSAKLRTHLSSVLRLLQSLKSIKASDAKQVTKCRSQIYEFIKLYESEVGGIHPALVRIKQIFKIFPGLVVPLELRESSDILMQKQKGISQLAIDKMLRAIEKISKGGNPKWYARGFIISMAESVPHLQAAAQKQIDAFGEIFIPVIPLFEEASSLADSDQIISQMLKVPRIQKAITKYWDNKVEMMVGYSDSSKESGVLASRLSIAEALPRLEKVCLEQKRMPVFFHGSGGSIDRGGGSVEDQTAWWPKSALKLYKVTVQGEMVERSLSSPRIARGQLEHILESICSGLESKKTFVKNKSLDTFAAAISKHYRAKITAPDFLNIVEKVTPYSYLNLLKIGSRPSKRAAQLQVSGLRAIPWILCWTQTRVLFPTWWGVGSAWNEMSATDKAELKNAFYSQPVFNSYIKALGFTLSKIDLSIWKIYLLRSSLSEDQKEATADEFNSEFDKTIQFYKELTDQTELMWFKPWLAESIWLRSPMIHPLNLLQIIAEEKKDSQLLRITVTGISSGMMTTG